MFATCAASLEGPKEVFAADLRIALTISGAVSLGAYEGGALAALLVAVQRLLRVSPPPIRIDAIGGASAGSITGLLATRTLLAGLDPVYVMHEAWVRRDSLAALFTRDPHAPLSLEPLRAAAKELLEPGPEHAGQPIQQVPVKLHMALAALRGLNYRIRRLDEPAIDASTYLDWGTFALTPGQEARAAYFEPKGASAIEFALASGANAFGFAPRKLNRKIRKEDLAELAKGRIVNFPRSGWLWYTDGGTVENEPLGRTLDLANDIDRDDPGGRRIHLLVHPHPTAPPDDDSWADPADQPEWTRTLVRAQMIQRTQSLYDDLRHVEKTNSRIVWTNRVVEVVTPLLKKTRASETALRDLVGEIRGEKAILTRSPENSSEPANETTDVPGDLEALLLRVLQEATGLAGKEEVRVEVVSPLILEEASGLPVERLLAGEFLGHFGGFLDEALRTSDFALGYRSMLVWLRGLGRIGLDPALTSEAVAAAEQRYDPRWDAFHRGDATFRTLPLGAQLLLYRLAVHVAWLSVKELAVRERR